MKFITKKDIKLPRRSPDSHKGDNGKVLAVGGSKDYAGAVALAGLAAGDAARRPAALRARLRSRTEQLCDPPHRQRQGGDRRGP